MATLTTDTNWTKTLPEGTYDIQKAGNGNVFVGRGAAAPSSTSDSMRLLGAPPLRFSVNPGDTAFFFGDGVEVYYYEVK